MYDESGFFGGFSSLDFFFLDLFLNPFLLDMVRSALLPNHHVLSAKGLNLNMDDILNYPEWRRFDKPPPRHRPEFAVHQGKARLDAGQECTVVLEYVTSRYTLNTPERLRVMNELVQHQIRRIMRIHLRQSLCDTLH